ncbi:hypothetical protein [Amycolatopsis sp. CB00013]|uniref:hypothetical protein n=1 Tax=Amycolatopsis sp. CB00013 TaxID=1703945 RepID=UPI000959A7C5|nr:hypothetical protein [Amycolatopsis sp. CB00013]OKJ95651.1 hypothetical protein AMK34_21830 [Amycolatopsis sp. CB00013]
MAMRNANRTSAIAYREAGFGKGYAVRPNPSVPGEVNDCDEYPFSAGGTPVEVHTATIPVHHSQFTISGTLFHTSDRALSAEVALKIWTHEPAHGIDETPHEEHIFNSPTGSLMIACITASPSDKNVPLPATGDYKLRPTNPHKQRRRA